MSLENSIGKLNCVLRMYCGTCHIKRIACVWLSVSAPNGRGNRGPAARRAKRDVSALHLCCICSETDYGILLVLMVIYIQEVGLGPDQTIL